MQVLFDSHAIERPTTFGSGIDVPPDRPPDEKDDAWWSGYQAGRDGEPCIPPSNLGKLLKRTWRAGWRKGAPHAPIVHHAAEMAESGPVDEEPIAPEPAPPAGATLDVTPEDRAWFHAYALTREGENAAEPDDVSPPELAAWREGRDAAIRDRDAEAARDRAGIGGPR